MKKALQGFCRLAGFEIKRISRKQQSAQLVQKKIGRYLLWMPSDHLLPSYLEHFPNYSSNLPRIIKLCNAYFQNFRFIDVGANIGDTVALVRSIADCPILCIEGDDEYFKLLEKNGAQFKDVQLLKTYLGANEQRIQASGEKSDGTLSLVQSEQHSVQLKKLDTVLQHIPEFQKAQLLKIDTDGFDLAIIKGAADYIRSCRPVLFFEYDPTLFRKQADSEREVFSLLDAAGYQSILVYDNFGNLLLSTGVQNSTQLDDLSRYIETEGNGINYYDLCIFHAQDEGLFKLIHAEEKKYFEQFRKK